MERVEYHLIQRRLGLWSDHGWWRPLVGIVVFFVGWVLIAPTATAAGFGVALAVLGSDDLSGDLRGLVDTDDVTPGVLAFLNISLASAIPITMAIAWFLHRQRPGWLSSVVGRLRWPWLLACLGLSVVALFATVLVSALLPAQEADVSTSLNAWSDEVRTFLLVILLLTPLQAAGEEYAFRGYLLQAFGGISRSRTAAVLLSSLLFALAHGVGQSPPIFFDRFAFGVVAGVLVITTGGLEAGIAMHVLNNFLAYGLALAFSDMTSALNPTGGSWWSIPVTLTQSLVYLGLATWLARRMGIATSVGQGPAASVLEGSEPRV